MRQRQPVDLGKQYAGSRVSRDALDAESDDEPSQAGTSDDESIKETAHATDETDESDEDAMNDSQSEDESLDDGSDDMDAMGTLPPFHGTSDQRKRKGGGAGLSTRNAETKNEAQHPEDGDNGKGTDLRQPPEKHRGLGTQQINGLSQDQSSNRSVTERDPGDGIDSDESRYHDQSEGHGKRIRDDRQDGDVDERSFSDADEDRGHEQQAVSKDAVHDGDTHRFLKVRHDGYQSNRDELRKLMANDQRTITATMSQAAKADANKGSSVKMQRKGFDAVLNTRIKLQKGMTAANQLAGTCPPDGKAVQSAEEAALALWSTIEDLRVALLNAQAKDESRKRKRPSPASSSESAASLWKRMADLEAESVAHRRAVLDKWSLKVRGSHATVPNARGKLLGSSAGQQNITAVLDAQIASEAGDRAAKRARSESNGHEDPEPIYDDTIFYQSLLRDLVEQRMSSDPVTNGLDSLHIQLPSRPSVHPVTGMRNDKNRKEVDTRASKGRKMRFHVHEKLQNFMAPEDRSTWTDRARDEFFASLLGKTASGMLREGDEASEEESEDDVEDGGLMLFRG